MQRLGIAIVQFADRDNRPNVETGVDVVTYTALGRFGIQVSEQQAGSSRATQKAITRERAEKHGCV
jgi:hypothetical protein